MEIKAEKITSDQAKEIIKNSGLQNYGDTKKIQQYKKWMEEGRWGLFYNRTSPKFINDPLIFFESGILFEGKHRVRALAKTEGLELDFWVLRNFGKEEMEIFDQWHSDWELTKVWKQ